MRLGPLVNRNEVSYEFGKKYLVDSCYLLFGSKSNHLLSESLHVWIQNSNFDTWWEVHKICRKTHCGKLFEVTNM